MAEHLAKSGYNVNIICSDKNLSKFQIINRVKIWNVYNEEIFKRNKYLKFFNIKKKIEEKSKEFNPDVIQIFNPLLIPLAIKLKKKFNCKLIYDCYEYWIGSGLTSKKYHFVAAYTLLHFLGFFYLDGIIFVYEKNPTSYFIDFFNKHIKNTSIIKCVIYNVPKNKILKFSPNKFLKNELFGDNDTIIIGYLGLIMKCKGYAEGIKSLNYLDNKYKLLLVGDTIDLKYKKHIEKLISKYKLQSRIIITGLIPHEKAMIYSSSFDIGLLLFEDTPWTRYSLPNKLFEYMALGIPIIATDIPNLRHIIKKNNCGLITKNNPISISKNIVKMNGEKNLLKKIKENNKKNFKKKYSEDIQMEKLLKLYFNVFLENKSR